jgi:HPt (histidine-containing phosphotransfer) domain-containing protein
MFRGGPVSSYGTGIATGLGYNDGGRVGYAKAGEVKSYEDTIKDEERKQEILSKGFKTEEDFAKEYEKKIEQFDPGMLMGIDEFGPGTFGEKATEEFGILSSDAAKNAYVSEKLAEQDKVVKEAEGLGVDSSKLPQKTEKIEIEEDTKTKINDGTGLNNFQEKSDKQVMQEYMDMFKESLGADKDELNRQRFLEIAKFGANLLAQPGGQTLGEAVGKAGAPALEGFSKIEAAERAADRQAKTLGFQAALKELEPGSLEKNARALAKLANISVSEAADRISKNASSGSVRNQSIKLIMDSLETSPGIAYSVSEIMVDNGIGRSNVIKHPDPTKTTGDEVVGKYYYFEKAGPGGEVMGKWDGEKFILPGEKGFK